MTKLQDFLNAPITQVSKLQRAPKQGDLYGVELECEGRHVDWDGSDPNLVKSWAPHADGSLRNNHGDSCEWVFNGPVKLKAAIERIGTLFKYFDKRKAKLVCSNRTSLHVHFNMGDKHTYQLVNLFILFTILEDLLDRYCGEDRRGNLFCLSSRHAEEQVQMVQDACFRHQNFNSLREEFRYCSLNLASIHKFGTVEFRAMRGLDNKEDIITWLNIIDEFCQYACYTMKNPVDLVEMISAKTPLGFVKEVFSKGNVALLTEDLGEYEINASVYEGLRLVQMLCYRIGTEFDQVRLRGRDFWASFSDGEEPIPDVDPRLLAAGGKAPARARGNRAGAVPGWAGPRADRQEAPADLLEIVEARARNRDRNRPVLNDPFAQEIHIRPLEIDDDF